jgi:glutathione synthase/RimK-type ligase-like ATP-grasp enzyme
MEPILLGIVERPRSFSDRWIEYCAERSIPFKRIHIYSNDLLSEVQGIRALLWNWSHDSFQSQLIARQIVLALEYRGLCIYPNSKSCWHYDDKLAQKYLLEAIGAPLVPTWIFYDFDEAMSWIKTAEFPKVFKLRKGAGSYNVRLVSDQQQAEKLCKVAFSRGFNPVPSYFADFPTKLRNVSSRRVFFEKLKRAPGIIWNKFTNKLSLPVEKGYVYFQEFMPDNPYDTRVAVIGNRAFGFLRHNRPGDFRASGGGRKQLNPDLVDKNMIRIAFDVSRKLGTQSLALDFVYNKRKEPTVLEMSYTFPAAGAIPKCPGYWNQTLEWQEGSLLPQDAIMEDLLAMII